jgi:threonine aldolase
MIDLSPDALTCPTPAMWAAMQDTHPGMASAGRDSAVNQLEALAAERMGKEAGLFVVTGRLANLLALLAHTQRGDQIILADYNHILWCEEWGLAAVAGLLARPINGNDGALQPAEIEAAITARHYRHMPHTGLVCIENSYDAAGGTIVTPEQTRAISAMTQHHGVPVHLDGSRVFNVAVALGVDVQQLVEPVDTVMFSLCKGLSAPMGSVLCGSRAFIERARRHLQVLGAGSLHKLGFAAAAGLVALETMVDRLAEDNRRARALAVALSAIEGITVDLGRVQTNMVLVDFSPTGDVAELYQTELLKLGVRTHLRSKQTLRLVTHRHISDADVSAAVEVFRQVVAQLQTNPQAP